MSNMSYCRYENTLSDLQDCVDYLEDKLSKSEHNSRKRLVQLCAEIADEYRENSMINEEWEYSAEKIEDGEE